MSSLLGVLLVLASTPLGTPIHVLRHGETLSALCQATYGSEHYAPLLALHGDIDATRLRIGQPFALPSLEMLIQQEGLGQRNGPAMQLVQAAERLHSVESRLWPLVGTRAALAAVDREMLVNAASLADDAANALRTQSSPAATQARGAASLLAKLTRGPDAYGYDIADTHRRLASALEALVRKRHIPGSQHE